MAPRASASFEENLPLSEGGTQSKGVQTSEAFLKIIQSFFFSKELWLQNILTFLSARASVLGDLHPFGPALFVAILIAGKRHRAVAAAFSVTLGAMTVLPMERVVPMSVVMILALLVSKGIQRVGARRRPARSLAALSVAASLFCVAQFSAHWLSAGVTVRGISIVIESVLIFITAIMIMPAANINWFDTDQYERRTLIALGFMTAVAGLGLKDVAWGTVMGSEVWHRWATLLAALIGGAAGGAAMGTGVGVLASLTGWLPLGGMGLYGVSGLFGGLFANRGKAGVAFGFLLGHMAVAIHASEAAEIIRGALHTALAMGLLALVPQRWIGRLQRGVPGSEAQNALQIANERRLRTAIGDRLDKVSGVFDELADVFGSVNSPELGGAPVEEGIHAIVEDAWSRQCNECSRFQSCWESNFYRSYWETVDLIAVAERKGRATVSDLPPGLKDNCHNKKEFVAAINAARQSNGGGNWSLERATAMDVVPHQLRGAAALVRKVADQVSVDAGPLNQLETRLWDEFSIRRIRVSRLHVAENGEHPEIDVEYNGECDGYGSCAVAILAAVESATSRIYTCVVSCRKGLEDTCHVRLAPEPPLFVNVSRARLAKGGMAVSGDTSSEVDLGGGKTALLLSDGMGSGDRAALESQAAVGMLEKMMRAGFDRSFSVSTINSVLLLRSADDVFATLDIAIIDQFTGDVEFLKVGSSPTFLKRNRDVEIVRSDSLPVGILSEIEFKENAYRLKGGDVIVMMTDGILDSFPDEADKEEWIARMLRRVDTTDPRELVELIVQRAKQAADGSIRDDMTVIVARLETR